MSVHPGSIWIDQHPAAELPRDAWFAANGNGVVAASETYDGLLEWLIARDIRLDSVAIAYFTSGVFQ